MSNDALNKIVDSLVEERKTERKFKLYSRVFFIVLFLIFFYFVLWNPVDNNIYKSEHTAVIKLNGVIANDGGVNTESTLKLVREAFNNDLCKNIILKINSPGGSATQSKIILMKLANLRRRITNRFFQL